MEVMGMRSAIVLAAGKGTRMKSSLNKVMHPVSNKPMIGHIVTNLRKAGVDQIVVVVGHGAESVKSYLGDRVQYALQEPQLGTGHAVMQAKCLKDVQGDTLVLNGDGPCIQSETIEALSCICCERRQRDDGRYRRVAGWGALWTHRTRCGWQCG